MRVLLVAFLLFGCASIPIQEKFEEPWVAVGEVELNQWESLPNEQKGEIIVLIMTIYFKKTECYEATLNISSKDKDTLIFSIKCRQRMVEVDYGTGKKSVERDEQGGAGGIVCHADLSRGSRYDQAI